MRRVAPEVAPDMILITNIFRDQLDRFGELYSMARMLEAAIETLPAQASAVLNGDDPLVASFAPDAQARRLFFGLRAEDVGAEVPEHAADTIRCVRCQHALSYHRVYLSHLGDYECGRCGKQTAGPGHRGHPGSGVAGRGQRHDRRDARGNHAAARAPAGPAQRLQRRRRARRGLRARDAGAGQRAGRPGRPAPGVRPPRGDHGGRSAGDPLLRQEPHVVQRDSRGRSCSGPAASTCWPPTATRWSTGRTSPGSGTWTSRARAGSREPGRQRDQGGGSRACA